MNESKLRTMQEVMNTFTKVAVALKTSGVTPPEEVIQAVRDTTKDIRELALLIKNEKSEPSSEYPMAVGSRKISGEKSEASDAIG